MGLKDYTSQQLFNELWHRDDVLAVKMWTRDDLLKQTQSLVNNSYPDLAEHIEEIPDLAMDGVYECLGEATEEEWNHIYGQVSDAIDTFVTNQSNAH